MWLLASALLPLRLATPITVPLPIWAQQYWHQHGLSATFRRSAYATPTLLQADFNGDGKLDVALRVTRIATKSEGILLLHQGLPAYYVAGAGSPTAPDISQGDFSWATHCSLYMKPTVVESTGDRLVERRVHLHHPAIWLWKQGSDGGLLYWTGKRYRWINQNC